MHVGLRHIELYVIMNNTNNNNDREDHEGLHAILSICGRAVCTNTWLMQAYYQLTSSSFRD